MLSNEDDQWALDYLDAHPELSGPQGVGSFRHRSENGITCRIVWSSESPWLPLCAGPGARGQRRPQHTLGRVCKPSGQPAVYVVDPGPVTCIQCIGRGA